MEGRRGGKNKHTYIWDIYTYVRNLYGAALAEVYRTRTSLHFYPEDY